MISSIMVVFAVALVIGLPIGLAICMAALAPGIINPEFAADAQYVIRMILAGADSTPILAIPMFMLSGSVMSRGGISQKLFDVFAYFFGKRTAGMPCTVIVTCLFFGAISGSGPATCAAVGGMAIPVLVSLGYDKVFAAATVSTAAGLGVIIPPSIPFILFGLSTGASVGSLFIAGIVPGLLVAALLMIYAYIYCKINGEDKEKITASVDALHDKGLFKLLKESFWAILTPIIILGGIYGGIVTPTEAATISVLYSLVVCIFIYRSITAKELLIILKESVRSYAPLLLVISVTTAFGRVLSLTGAPQMLADFLIKTYGNSQIPFLLSLAVVLLIIGMFVDVAPAILILAPMMVPVSQALNINEVHMGVIVVVALAIGFVSPPFGLNLFVAAPMVQTPVMTLAKKCTPYIIAFLIALLIIILIPQVSLILL